MIMKIRELNPLQQRFGPLGLVSIGAAVLVVGLFVRTEFLAVILDFVLEVIGWVAIIGGAGLAIAGIVSFGDDQGWWQRLKGQDGALGDDALGDDAVGDDAVGEATGRQRADGKVPAARRLSSTAVFALILVFFLLPWTTVTCEDSGLVEEIGTFSGTDLMGLTGGVEQAVGEEYTVSDAVDSEAALLYFAVLLALSGAALFFLPGKKGNYLRAGIGMLGVVTLLVYIALLASNPDLLTVERESGFDIRFSWRFGYWLAVVGFLVTVLIQFIPTSLPGSSKAAE